MAAKDRQRGKALEREVGRLFGGRRRHNGEGIDYDDCVQQDGTPLPISIEAKAYSVLQLRQDWITQAKRNSTGRPWIVVQRPKGSHTIYATCDLDFLHGLCVKAGLITPTEPDKETNGIQPPANPKP